MLRAGTAENFIDCKCGGKGVRQELFQLVQKVFFVDDWHGDELLFLWSQRPVCTWRLQRERNRFLLHL